MSDETKDAWFAVFLTEFIMMFIINALTLVAFAKTHHLRKRRTYLIMNLTVADLGQGVVGGPVTLWFFRTGKQPGHGFKNSYICLMISDIFYVASLGNLALISLERLHATLYPFRHCLVGERTYYKIIILGWFGALTLSSVLSVIHMNDAVAGRYTWIIYILLILVVLLTSYVIIISKVTRKTPSQQLRSVISAERKLSVTLFIVSAASTLTLLPWVITTLISVLSSGFPWIQFSPHGRISSIVLAFYYLNSILNPVIYAIRLPEFRRALKGFFCGNNSSAARARPLELRVMQTQTVNTTFGD